MSQLVTIIARDTPDGIVYEIPPLATMSYTLTSRLVDVIEQGGLRAELRPADDRRNDDA